MAPQGEVTLNKILPPRLKSIVLAVAPHRERLQAETRGYRIHKRQLLVSLASETESTADASVFGLQMKSSRLLSLMRRRRPIQRKHSHILAVQPQSQHLRVSIGSRELCCDGAKIGRRTIHSCRKCMRTIGTVEHRQQALKEIRVCVQPIHHLLPIRLTRQKIMFVAESRFDSRVLGSQKIHLPGGLQ